MKIAQVAPPWLTVPPQGYGGTEVVIAQLCNGLAERGHEVTLFAAGGSDTRARLVSCFPEALGTARMVKEPYADLPHILNAYGHAQEFDVIHDHTFPVGPSIAAHLGRPPAVHTLHGPPWYPGVRPVYEKLAQRLHFVAISEFQRAGLPGLNYAATIYNGIDLDLYPYESSKEDYLLFVGRVNPEKGPHLAVEVARRLGRRLVMALKMAEPDEKRFFEAEVVPRLTGKEEIIPEISVEEKAALYARASCTLMPIQWPEPFGLVMTESMACGTPVVAFRNGSVPEIIDHGVTGFVVDDQGDLDGFAACVERAAEIDPAACRERVATHFSREVMVQGYEEVYRRAIASP